MYQIITQVTSVSIVARPRFLLVDLDEEAVKQLSRLAIAAGKMMDITADEICAKPYLHHEWLDDVSVYTAAYSTVLEAEDSFAEEDAKTLIVLDGYKLHVTAGAFKLSCYETRTGIEHESKWMKFDHVPGLPEAMRESLEDILPFNVPMQQRKDVQYQLDSWMKSKPAISTVM